MVYLIIRNDMTLMHIDKKQYVFSYEELKDIFKEWGMDNPLTEGFDWSISNEYLILNPNLPIDNRIANEFSHWSIKDIEKIKKLIKPFSRESNIDLLIDGNQNGHEEENRNDK
jgi:hypothetical protein